MGEETSFKNVVQLGVVADGETDNIKTLNQIILDANKGDTLYFPAGNYFVSENLKINKMLNLVGVKPNYKSGDLTAGSVIRGGGIFLIGGSSGTNITGIGVVNNPDFTNCFDVRGALSAISFKNCLAIPVQHGFLIESYDGEVSNTVVDSCESYDGIHGFISKALRTTFVNCLAMGMSNLGFGIISDNIPAKNSIGMAVDNKVIGCRAVNVSGDGFMQCRRYYYEDNEGAVICNANQFIGCSGYNCTHSLTLGENVGNTGWGKYRAYAVSNTLVAGFTEYGGPVRFLYTTNLTIAGLFLRNEAIVKQDEVDSNMGMVASGVNGAKFGQFDDILPLEDGVKPNIGFGRTFRTANTVGTVITDFTNPISGQVYTIIIGDSNTSIRTSETIQLSGSIVKGTGSSVILRYQDGIYYEIGRSMSKDWGTQLHATDESLELGDSGLVDLLQASTDKPRTTTIVNPELHNAYLTVINRSTNGEITPPDFNQNQFIVPDDLSMDSLDWGQARITNWVYVSALGKYVLSGWRITKYY